MAYGASGNTKSSGNTYVSEFKIKEQMCEIGRRIWLKGFCAGNEGNHSYRIGENRVLCTPTGISKGFLKPDDICITDIEGKQIGGKRKWVWIKPWGNDALTEDEMEELRERLTPSWAASAPRTPSTSTAGSHR